MADLIGVDFLGKNTEKLKDKKLFLFDMDGTIYLGNNLFDGVKELLSLIKNRGGRYVFITNNSSKSVSAYIEKLGNLGIVAKSDDFFTSSEAAVSMINKKHSGALVYAQGTKSFIDYLKSQGLNVTEEYDETAGVILVGFDTELDFNKEIKTCKMLTKLSVPYYATNPDWVCPTEFGYVPDCGSMCFGYEKATGRKPIFIGKPDPAMIYAATEKFGFDKNDVLVIGDRLYTDIASGCNAGVDTLFVLSGEGTMEDYKKSDVKSTFVLKNVKELLEIIK